MRYQIKMEQDGTASCTFPLAYLCQCAFPLDEMTTIPTTHTALQVVWLANTSHILIDSATIPQVMSTIAFRQMIKIQFELTDLLVFKDTDFNQIMIAEHGHFSFTPLNGKNLEMIRCQQNACIIQLHTPLTTMVAKENSILEHFQQINNMVIDTGH